MKKVINSDRVVRKLAKKHGAWATIVESIANGKSGALVSCNNWVFGYFEDGLIAVEADNPLDAAMIFAQIGRNLSLNGPLTLRQAKPSWPTTH